MSEGETAVLQGPTPDPACIQIVAPSNILTTPQGTMMAFAIPVMVSGFVPCMTAFDPSNRPQPQQRSSDDSVYPDQQVCATHLSFKKRHAKLQNKKIETQAEGDCKTGNRRGPVKLRNKKLEVQPCLTSPSTQRAIAQDYSEHVAAAVAARREEQLLRTELDELSTKASSFDGEAVSDEVPRIGIDIGGVLLESHRDHRSMWEVPGGERAIRDIIEIFGVSNVFLVSKVQLGGKMHTKTKEWLHGSAGFLERIGLPSENVAFVSAISGIHGKGVEAKRLGLSHFVDNRWEVLEAVFSDRAGNSLDSVQRFHGTLFHFATGGLGQRMPELSNAARARLPPEFYSYYTAVSGWSEVLEILQRDARAKASEESNAWMFQGKLQCTSESQRSAGQGLEVHPKSADSACAIVSRAPVSMRVVDVGIEEDGAFAVVRQLLGTDGEHFKWIASSAGVKVILHGRGSPHPQPQSRQRGPLQVCIRSSNKENLKSGIAMVEELIDHVHQNYHEFRQRLVAA